MRRTAFLGSLALLLASACTTPQEAKQKQANKNKPVVEDDGGKSTPPKEPEPPPREPLAKAAISSVQMIQDCPKDNDSWRPPPPPSRPSGSASAAKPMQAPAAPAEPAAGAMAMDEEMLPGAARVAGGGGFEQPCTQSTMQLAFTGQGDTEAKVQIEAVRIIDPASGKSVGTVDAREPASWVDGAYQSWDQTIGPKTEVKSSYKLSVPDWSAVEKSLGGKSSFGYMFILEVDVKVGDERQTVRSAQFPREEPHVIVT